MTKKKGRFDKVGELVRDNLKREYIRIRGRKNKETNIGEVVGLKKPRSSFFFSFFKVIFFGKNLDIILYVMLLRFPF